MVFIILELGKDISGVIWKKLDGLSKLILLCKNSKEFSKKFNLCGFSFRNMALLRMVTYGYMDIIKCLKIRRTFISTLKFSTSICNVAALNGRLEILKWAIETGFKCDYSTTCYAARRGHLEMLKWLLLESKYSCNKEHLKSVFLDAVWGEHLNVLKWLHESGHPYHPDSCVVAAGNGSLNVLKWLKETGLPWQRSFSGDICVYAAIEGQLEVLKWARENDCEWNESTCKKAVARKNNADFVKWLGENNCPCHGKYHALKKIDTLKNQ